MHSYSWFHVRGLEDWHKHCSLYFFWGGFPHPAWFMPFLSFLFEIKGNLCSQDSKKNRGFSVKILSYPKIKDLVFRKIPQQIVRGISKTNFKNFCYPHSRHFLPVWGRQFHACIVSNVFQHSKLLFCLFIPVFCLIFLVICVLFYKNWVIASNQPPGCFSFSLHFGSILILQVELKTKTPQNVFVFKDTFYCTSIFFNPSLVITIGYNCLVITKPFLD